VSEVATLLRLAQLIAGFLFAALVVQVRI